MLKSVDKEKFIEAIEQGVIYVDFDARTGQEHNRVGSAVHSTLCDKRTVPLLHSKKMTDG